jgi:hypothetical protein
LAVDIITFKRAISFRKRVALFCFKVFPAAARAGGSGGSGKSAGLKENV